VVDTLTFTVVVAALVLNIFNFVQLRKKDIGCTPDCKCRYPDSDIQKILIEYELEKAKELDKAIHDVEQK